MRTSTVTVNHEPNATARLPVAPQCVRITASGDLTKDACVLKLNRTSLDALSRRAEQLILDLEGVTDADTKLIAVLISLYANCRRQGVALEWRLSPMIVAWLSIYDLTWIAEVDGPSPVA